MRGRRASTTRSYRSDWLDLSLWFRRQHAESFDASRLDADMVEGWRTASENKGEFFNNTPSNGFREDIPEMDDCEGYSAGRCL